MKSAAAVSHVAGWLGNGPGSARADRSTKNANESTNLLFGFPPTLLLSAVLGLAAIAAILAGTLIYLGKDPNPSVPPSATSAPTPTADQSPSPIASTTTAAPLPQSFGAALRFSSVTGDRYEARTTSIARTTSTQGKIAPAGSTFLVLTIRETNLRKDRAAPEKLASSPGKVMLAVPRDVRPRAESVGLGSCEIPDSDTVGDLVQKDPQGISPLPVGACTFALVAASTTESVENQLGPGKSVQIQFASNGYFPEALPIDELQVWAQFAFTNTAAQLSLP